jgi:hypothetical protein
VKRVLLVFTVALVMALMVLVVAMPAFAQAANPCETGDTPSSPPDVGGAPSSPTPDSAPGYTVRDPEAAISGRGRSQFTGPNLSGRCDNSL